MQLGIQLGSANEFQGGVNFALFSRHATRVWLELFAQAEDASAARRIELDSLHHRTGDVWHVWVGGLQLGQLYAYRVEGPYRPEEELRFNVNKLLLDPYASALAIPPAWDFSSARGNDPTASPLIPRQSVMDDAAVMPKCIYSRMHFDWQEDRSPHHPWSRTIIYETHVRGLTMHPSSATRSPGTYQGVIEKIPYFRELGVTAVELMPVQEFNSQQVVGVDCETGKPLRNYWGFHPGS